MTVKVGSRRITRHSEPYVRNLNEKYMTSEQITLNNLDETKSFADDFAKRIQSGDVLALCGDLGSGKTTFTQCLYEFLGGDPDYLVTSPTFTLLQEYPISLGTLHHLDLYRLDSFQDLVTSDLLYCFDPEGISIVEWADKFTEIKDYIAWKLEFKIVDQDIRQCTFTKIKP